MCPFLVQCAVPVSPWATSRGLYSGLSSLNGYENIDRIFFFTVKEERRTRGHGVTLAKKQCRLDIRKFSFSQRTVNEWNRLSADCVGASSVNIF